ncbi:MAG: molybdate ABC transporter substrate-binding protein [Bacteroidota bacterium]|jgi:molybdate transport system substrate-binding protein
MRFLLLFFVFIFLGCEPSERKIPKKTINIAVSANMQFAMRDIALLFEKKENIKVEIMIGASGKLTHQILNGAPFHLFVSADTLFTRKIITKGMGIGQQHIYAIGSLVLWTNRKDLKNKNLFNLLTNSNVNKISLPNPNTAPYGFQAKLALEKAGLWKKISSKVILGESIAQATQYIYSGVCEVGFVSKSVLFSPELKNKGYWQEVPNHLYEPIYQGFVITQWGQENNMKASTSFSQFMKTPAVKDILLKNGYQLPDKE